ncbi:hypothetical protein JCGZ_05203 [Jatropha curcas]|uniref:Uncharacterized protein n=1 Tax=Jatropha curcas TaxID=180498 RepID=A0A067KQC1_JATCU|nr:hypothetical protein JCGZ_05203 [Jatropha curcas]
MAEFGEEEEERERELLLEQIYEMVVNVWDDSNEGWFNQSEEVWVGSEYEVTVNPITPDIWSSKEEEEARSVNHMTRSGRVYQPDMVKPREENEKASSSDIAIEHKRKIYLGLEIIVDAIEILAVEPSGLEFGEEKKEEKELEEEEGVEGPQAAEEDKQKEGQAA